MYIIFICVMIIAFVCLIEIGEKIFKFLNYLDLNKKKKIKEALKRKNVPLKFVSVEFTDGYFRVMKK